MKTMFRVLLSLLCVLALLMQPVVCKADLAEIEKKGVLRVLAGIDRRPQFFSLASETAPGLDYEIVQGFASAHRLKVEVIPVQVPDNLIPALLAGKGDFIAGRFANTESRRQQIHFTNEVFPLRYVVMTRKPHHPIWTLQQLRSEKVGTMKGSAPAALVAQVGVPPSHVDDGLIPGAFPEALKSERVTAVVWGAENAILLRQVDPAFEMGMFLAKPQSYAFGVRKEDGELLKALNEHIAVLYKTGVWHRLVVKYFGNAALDVLKTSRSESTEPTRD